MSSSTLATIHAYRVRFSSKISGRLLGWAVYPRRLQDYEAVAGGSRLLLGAVQETSYDSQHFEPARHRKGVRYDGIE